MTDVSDILRDRLHEPSGLQKMIVVSLFAHIVFLSAVLLSPRTWFKASEQPATVMTISLGGGGEGPRSGTSSIGGRPVQEQAPPPDVKRPEPVRPPAAKTPEMVLPTKAAAKPSRPTTPVKDAPDEARGRTPTQGAETSTGSAVAVTGARGQGFGLSSGGGPGSGSRLDVANFCCPDYLITMTERIRSNWNQKQDVPNEAISVVKFTIQRDGTLANIALEQSSGSPILDLAAQRAVALTRQLPPLPTQFPDQTLGVHLTFVYQR